MRGWWIDHEEIVMTVICAICTVILGFGFVLTILCSGFLP